MRPATMLLPCAKCPPNTETFVGDAGAHTHAHTRAKVLVFLLLMVWIHITVTEQQA